MSTKTTFLTTCKMKWTRIKNPVWKQRIVAKYKGLPLAARGRLAIYGAGWVFLIFAAASLTVTLNSSPIWIPIALLSFLGFGSTSVVCFYKALSE